MALDVITPKLDPQLLAAIWMIFWILLIAGTITLLTLFLARYRLGVTVLSRSGQGLVAVSDRARIIRNKESGTPETIRTLITRQELPYPGGAYLYMVRGLFMKFRTFLFDDGQGGLHPMLAKEHSPAVLDVDPVDVRF